jgi:hypothetical protein
MKHFLLPCCLAAFALLLANCASDLKEKQDMAAAAGFKVITPTKPEHVAMLPTLPKDKVTQITYEGKTYYVLPDVEHNQAWVGGPKQYEAYQRMRIAKQISDQNAQAAQMNQMAATNWGMWGGWGRWGRYGWY